MSDSAEDTVRRLLSTWIDPWLELDWIQSGCLQQCDVKGTEVELEIHLPYPCATLVGDLVRAVQDLLEEHGLSSRVHIQSRISRSRVRSGLAGMETVRNIIAVASGKGGVGKSTTALEMAYALQREGARVGVLDADIYGPSLPLLTGIPAGTRPGMHGDKEMLPFVQHGLQLMSLGWLTDEQTPVIWRGPMATGALIQMLSQTHWQDLDYLLIDMPPGTGDIALTLAQKIPVSGAVVVSTPQDLARIDAVRAIEMFRKVDIPVLGVVENMSVHICSQCGHHESIFGEGAADQLARDYQVGILERLPLDGRIRAAADKGMSPVQQAKSMADILGLYRNLAVRMAVALARQEQLSEQRIPNLVMN